MLALSTDSIVVLVNLEKDLNMAEIILHHYALSPFSEKIRRILAFKQMPWQAVEQPIMAPKPELTPLTGGYRRIPVMQIGADIYCDTALIARRLEAIAPEPETIPSGLCAAVAMIEDWADHRLFMFAVPPTVSALADDLPPEFFADRQQMSPGFDRNALAAAAPHALAQCCFMFDRLAAQLSTTDYLLGDAFTLADAACFHPLRFMMNSPELAPHISTRAALNAWVQRIEAMGVGKVSEMAGQTALDIARDAEPQDTDGDSVSDAPFGPGDEITIIADDYGQETTQGRVVRVRADDVTVLRNDEQLGTLAVHYPRAGYRFTT